MPLVQNTHCIFFLDAHLSGQDTNWNQVERVPLLDELDIILSFPLKSSIFIINDVRLWKQQVWDWAHITNHKILTLFTKRNIELHSFYEKNDKFYIRTK